MIAVVTLGQLPVAGSSYLHCLQKLLTTPPRPLLEARPDAPRDLAEIVDRLRARNPADRPQTADEVAKRLRAILERLDAPGAAAGRTPAQLPIVVAQLQITAQQ